MKIQLNTGASTFNPNFKPEPTDYLGRKINRTHNIVAELMPTPSGERIWEVQCRICRYGYLCTDSQLEKGTAEQPCRCSNRRTNG